MQPKHDYGDEPLHNMLYLLARKTCPGLPFDDRALALTLQHWQIDSLRSLLGLSKSDLRTMAQTLAKLAKGSEMPEAE